MADGQQQKLGAYLQQLTQEPLTASSDDQLLERFLLENDEATFTTLLQRHGPLVWSVCRRVLGEEHAAEDAFQAVFLVLLRKAASISKRASLRSWLYGVSVRVAVRARTREQSRRLRERALPARSAGDESAAVLWEEVRSILDEEIQRLPERYRLVVILCYLEGQTNDEAAQVLQCPRGTIATWLARARERLRRRLARRGLEFVSAGFAVLLSERSLSAAPPSALVRQTGRVARLGATGQTPAGTVPESVTVLMEGALHAMSLTKFLTVVSVLALVLSGGAGLCIWALAQAPPQPKKEPPPAQPRAKEEPPAPARAPKQDAETLKKLLEERVKLAQEEVKSRQMEFEVGRQPVQSIVDASARLLKAELEAHPDKEGRKAAYERHLKTMQTLADFATARFEAGALTHADRLFAQYQLVDAKINLEREKFPVEDRSK